MRSYQCISCHIRLILGVSILQISRRDYTDDFSWIPVVENAKSNCKYYYDLLEKFLAIYETCTVDLTRKDQAAFYFKSIWVPPNSLVGQLQCLVSIQAKLSIIYIYASISNHQACLGPPGPVPSSLKSCLGPPEPISWSIIGVAFHYEVHLPD